MHQLKAVFAIVLFMTIGHAKVLHTERSLYRNISIEDDNGIRCMIFESRKTPPPYQTCVDLKDKQKLYFNYTKLVMSGLLYNPSPSKVLVIGLGGGTLPMTINQILPNTEVTSVEIDEAVVTLAKKYFDYNESDTIKTEIKDGRLFVKRALLKNLTFDWIILDAFNGDYIPEHLMTQEFFTELKTLLSKDGIITSNTFSDSKLYDHESTTYFSVFGAFYNIKNKYRSNRIVLATNSPSLKSMKIIRKNAEALFEPFKTVGLDSYWLAEQFNTKSDWNKNARVLTDQYSPANLLKTD